MKQLVWIFAAIVGVGAVVFALSNVSVDPGSSGVEVARTIGEESGIKPFSPNEKRDFDAELFKLSGAMAYFARVTLDRKQVAIPLGEHRELEDWYVVKSGICSDVSRAAETFLTYLGFRVRHVSIYTLKHNSNPYAVAITYRNPSHAVTEVLTSRGWMLFDPHFGRQYVDANGNPVPAARMYEAIRVGDINADDAHVIFSDQYSLFYGLYSRHGLFYPPYVPVPDIAWTDFLQYGCCEVVR